MKPPLSDRLADLFVRRRGLAIAFVAGVSLVCGAGYIVHYRDDATWTRRTVVERGEDAARLREANAGFALRRADCQLVIDAPDVFSPAAIDAVRAIVARLRRLPQVESVLWLDDVPVVNAFGLSDPILPPAGSSRERYADARQEVLSHPLIVGQLVSGDGTTLLIPINFNWLEVTSDEDVSTELSRAVADELKRHPRAGLRARFTGDVPLFLTARASNRYNQYKFQIIGYALTVLTALVLFRSPAPIIIVGCAPIIGILWTWGVLRLMGEPSNPISSIILPVMLSMVGTADGVHLMVHVRSRMGAGATRLEAARSAIAEVGPACWLTSLTTAIGFGSLMLAQSELVRAFGKACAIGVLLTFVSVVVLIPLLSSTRLGRNLHKGHERDFIGRGVRLLTPLVDGILRWRWPITAAATLATIAFASAAFTLEPDSRLSESIPLDTEAYAALDQVDRKLGGIEQARIVVSWSDKTPDDSPLILAAIADAERAAREEPLLGRPLSINSVLATFPGDSADLEGRLAMVDLMPDDLRQSFIDRPDRRALVSMRVQDRGLAVYRPVFARLGEKLAELEKTHPGFNFELTGEAVVRVARLHEIVTDLSSSLATAAVIILIVMALAYRSLRIGLITIVPNLFPLAATSMLLLLLGESLTISCVCAFVVCLGIAVDDTIHFLSRYRREPPHVPVGEALRRTFTEVGTALVTTTVIMIVGFATVLTSDLSGQRAFAAMACCTIAAALLGDLVFLPAMLACFDRRREKQPEHRSSSFNP